jgi:hypothetical protein
LTTELLAALAEVYATEADEQVASETRDGHRNLPESISRLDDTGGLVRLLAAKTEFKTIASKIIQHPAVTIERIKLRRRVIELSVQTTIEGR